MGLWSAWSEAKPPVTSTALAPVELSQWDVTRWGLDAGLPQSSVTGVTESQDGRLWVSTYAGLTRFDGVAFEPLTLKGQALPIRVTDMTVDKAEPTHIWIATEGEGLWLLTDHRLSEQVTLASVTLPEALLGATIYHLHSQARGARAGLWVATDRGTYHRGLTGGWSRFHERKGRATTFELTMDEEGTLWSCSDQRLSMYQSDSVEPTPLLPPPLTLDTPVAERPACRGGLLYDGHYFGLFEDALWLISPDGEWREVKARVDQGRRPRALGGAWRQRPWRSPDGVLWLLSATEALSLGDIKAVIQEAQAGRPVDVKSYPLGYHGRVMFSSSEGSVWVGTLGGGLYRLSSLDFSRVLWPSAEELSQVGPLAQTQRELWFVKGYQELWRVWEEGGARRYEELQLPIQQTNKLISAMGGRLNGDLLIAREGELLTYVRADRSFERRDVERELSGYGKVSLITAQGSARASSSEGAWWIGTHGGGVFSTTSEGELIPLELPSELSLGKVLSLVELQPQGSKDAPLRGEPSLDLAIGHTRGVSVRRDGIWRSFSASDGLPRGDARALLEGPKGVIWVATYGGGLGWIDPKGAIGSLDIYDAHLSALALTEDGSLWAQGNKGLTRVKLSDLERLKREPRWPLVTELLKVGEANGWVRNSAVLRADGELWLAGVDGLSVTQTAQLMSSDALPAPELRSASIGDYSLSIPQRAQGAPLTFQEAPADAFRRLEVQYHTSLLDRSRSVGYEHRLSREGAHEELPWLPAGSSKLLTYTNLEPGRYRLQIRSVSLEYAPSEVTELGVYLPAKWHELLWVQALLGLLLVTIPTLITLWRARLISLHNRQLRSEIEQRVIAEERLRDRETRYRQVFNEASNAFLLYTHDGECVEVNQQAQSLFQCSAEELIGASPRALGLPPLERWAVVGESEQSPLLCARLDGSVFPARMSYVSCASDGYEMWLVSIMDLSAIVSAHEQQTWVHHQLSVARRMDALGRLSSGIAHDLNNILGALSGNIELIRDDLPSDAWLEESLEDIIECLKRGSSLSQQLLAFSRIQTTQTQDVLDPLLLIKRLEKLLHRLMPKGVSLVVDLSETGKQKLNQGLFERVLLTLTLHAAEASPARGEVLLRLRTGQDGALQLSVEDQGPAVPMHTLSALLEHDGDEDELEVPALVLVHRWMTEARGRLSVSRKEHSNLALVEWSSVDSTPLPRERREGQEKGATRSYRLVVVDDNQELRRVLVRQLTSLGHQVESYGDPLEALEEMNTKEMPDVLISDVIMPGLNGRQLTSELRQTFPTLKVIFISGYTSDVLGEVNKTGDRELLLHKPFTKQVLRKKIEELMAGEAKS